MTTAALRAAPATGETPADEIVAIPASAAHTAA
jgi:hypothetical protein